MDTKVSNLFLLTYICISSHPNKFIAKDVDGGDAISWWQSLAECVTDYVPASLSTIARAREEAEQQKSLSELTEEQMTLDCCVRLSICHLRRRH